jgi:hypothetical protein
MMKVYEHWIATAAHPENTKVKIAVNTAEDRESLGVFEDVIVAGDKRRGAAYPTHLLYRSLEARPEDIIVLVADDTFSPQGWDEWLTEQFREHDDAIVVNDGGQFGPCITQPIMTFGCVLKLNRVVLHPSYFHFCADVELYNNLSEMGLLRDLRRSEGPVFEHRNWSWGKRNRDGHDDYNCSMWGRDEGNLRSRMGMPISERLKVSEPVESA